MANFENILYNITVPAMTKQKDNLKNPVQMNYNIS